VYVKKDGCQRLLDTSEERYDMKWEKREDLKEKGGGALLFTSSLPGATCLPSIPWLIAMMIVPNGLERDPGLPELPGLAVLLLRWAMAIVDQH
jgi:hypothetical protein